MEEKIDCGEEYVVCNKEKSYEILDFECKRLK
jgi:hypothetical protein